MNNEEFGGPSHALDTTEAVQVLKAAEISEQYARFRMDELHRKFIALAMKVPNVMDDVNTDENSKMIFFKNLNDELMRDIDGSIEASKRWPLVIDNTDQTGIFLRYCDTNYLDSFHPRNMEAESIRKAIIVRYGKAVVVDLQGTDMFEAVTLKFNDVLVGLMDLLLSKEILSDEKYLELVRPSDGNDYDKAKFTKERIKNFKLDKPPVELVDKTFVVRVQS
uniref:Uncharacterized protein n=1 Tax=Strigamia maritima TaxID=126957 RepID=T1J6U7_STRMM